MYQGIILRNIIDTSLYIVNINILLTSHTQEQSRKSSSPTYSQIIGDNAQICIITEENFEINKNYLIQNFISWENEQKILISFSNFSKVERDFVQKKYYEFENEIQECIFPEIVWHLQECKDYFSTRGQKWMSSIGLVKSEVTGYANSI